MFDGCKDSCCYYGEKISRSELSRIIPFKAQLELLVSKPFNYCFSGDFLEDNDYDGAMFAQV